MWVCVTRKTFNTKQTRRVIIYVTSIPSTTKSIAPLITQLGTLELNDRNNIKYWYTIFSHAHLIVFTLSCWINSKLIHADEVSVCAETSNLHNTVNYAVEQYSSNDTGTENVHVKSKKRKHVSNLIISLASLHIEV